MSGPSGLAPQQEPIPGATEWIAECETLTTRKGHRIAYRRRGSGPTVLLLHGFPTWSYDYAAVAKDLEPDHDILTFNFLGYGASDKPNSYKYSVAESADTVEDLLALLGIASSHLVVHDYGGIVSQELLDRQHRGKLPFSIESLAILNCGIDYSAYRPTMLQRLLAVLFVGGFIASCITASMWTGPLHLIWGLDDPVSGKHVLDLASEEFKHAVVTRLEGVGHFPQNEAPKAVAKAIRAAVVSRLPPTAAGSSGDNE